MNAVDVDGLEYAYPDGTRALESVRSVLSRSAVAVYIAAVHGLGVARIPEYVPQGRPDSRCLRFLFTERLPLERALKAYFPRSPHTPAKVRAFLRCLEEADLENKRGLRALTAVDVR